MHTGRVGTTAEEVHRQAILTGAVRVFCTYVQHDVARMVHAGVEGSAEDMFRAAIKNQMMRGEGGRISALVNKIVHHPDNMPEVTDAAERGLLMCIMSDYDAAKSAVQSGTAREYRSTRLLQGVMDVGGHISDEEDTDSAVETFLRELNESLTGWDAYTPRGPFETIVHGMVLNHGSHVE